MDQAPGLLALQDRGPGFALLPGAARRSAPPLKEYKKTRGFHQLMLDQMFFLGLLTVGRFLDQRFWNVFLMYHIRQPMRCLLRLRLYMQTLDQLSHSQPVLKKLVCDRSTHFHE